MKRYNIVIDGYLLGVIDVNEDEHQPTYTVTNIDGKTSQRVNRFKNARVAREYIEWCYPDSRLVKVTE